MKYCYALHTTPLLYLYITGKYPYAPMVMYDQPDQVSVIVVLHNIVLCIIIPSSKFKKMNLYLSDICTFYCK